MVQSLNFKRDTNYYLEFDFFQSTQSYRYEVWSNNRVRLTNVKPFKSSNESISNFELNLNLSYASTCITCFMTKPNSHFCIFMKLFYNCFFNFVVMFVVERFFIFTNNILTTGGCSVMQVQK